MYRLNISIAAVPITLIFQNKAFFNQSNFRYELFTTEKEGITINITETSSFKQTSLNATPALNISNMIRISRYDFTAEIGNNGGTLETVPTLMTLDCFLRVLYSVLLLDTNALILHSAGLKINGHGFLFPGKSGAGKTTIAKKFNSGNVISDELCVIRDKMIYGTPFWGEFQKAVSNLNAPLKAICFLNRNLSRGVHRLNTAKGAIGLLECVTYFEESVNSARRILDIITLLVNDTQVHEFSYNAEIEFEADIKKVLTESI